MATFTPFPVPVRMAVLASSAEIHCVIFCYFGAGKLVHRLAYNGDVAAGQLAVFQGGPRRTGGKAPISGLIRVKRATRKNSQLAAARRVALKMGRSPLLHPPSPLGRHGSGIPVKVETIRLIRRPLPNTLVTMRRQIWPMKR